MFLTTVAPALRTLITALALEPADVPVSPVPPFAARDADFQRTFTHPTIHAEILLRVTSIRQSANGFKLTHDNTNPDPLLHELRMSLEGMRDFTLNIQARSWRQNDAHLALEYAERIATRLDLESSTDALLAVNCIVYNVGEILSVTDVKIDDRLLSVANLDVFLRAGFGPDPASSASEAIGWFNKIELSSAVANPGGTEYPIPSVNVDDVLIPPGL